MSIVLSHGYFLYEDAREQLIMKPYPPLGILYLSAWLDRHGVAHEVYDTTFSQKTPFYQYLLEHKPRILALYVNLMTKLNILEMVRWLRTQPDLRDTLVVLGGPDVTHNAADYLTAGADLIVVGEGEQTMLDIALAYEADTDRHTAFGHIAGLVFFDKNNCLVKTPPREKLRDLDDLPIPARHRIDLGQYLRAWKQAHGHSAVSVSTQRGCPYTCKWCSTAVYGQSYRRRSPKAVVDELVQLQQAYDFDLIWFVDDVFTVSHKWLEGFYQELQQRQVKIAFECITRADRLNEQVVQLLRACGCFRVWIGAESGSQRILDAMDRRVQATQVQDMIQAARRTGMETGTFIMLGYPGETEQDILETVAHLKAANPDLFTITVAYPIKGTGLYEEVTATTDVPWEQRTDRDLDFPRTYPRRYYDYAVRWTTNAVHGHKARLAGKPGLRFVLKAAAARVGMWWWRKNLV